MALHAQRVLNASESPGPAVIVSNDSPSNFKHPKAFMTKARVLKPEGEATKLQLRF
jgi:hypothetical protein